VGEGDYFSPTVHKFGSFLFGGQEAEGGAERQRLNHGLAGPNSLGQSVLDPLPFTLALEAIPS